MYMRITMSFREVNDDNFSEYIGYWIDKYYWNRFCDGTKIIIGCLYE